jgi:hypothetical protein
MDRRTESEEALLEGTTNLDSLTSFYPNIPPNVEEPKSSEIHRLNFGSEVQTPLCHYNEVLSHDTINPMIDNTYPVVSPHPFEISENEMQYWLGHFTKQPNFLPFSDSSEDETDPRLVDDFRLGSNYGDLQGRFSSAESVMMPILPDSSATTANNMALAPQIVIDEKLSTKRRSATTKSPVSYRSRRRLPPEDLR